MKKNTVNRIKSLWSSGLSLVTLSSLLLASNAHSQTTIAAQDFDSLTTWSYSSDVTFFDNTWGGDGFYGIIDIAGAGPLDYANLAGNILGENDLDDEGENGTSGQATTTFANIDISTFANVNLSFDYDIVGYNANADEAFYQLIYDGTPQGFVVLQTGSTPGDDAEGSVFVSIPSSVNEVGLEIIIQNNGGSGYSGFDNFLLQSSLVAPLIAPTDFSVTSGPAPNNKEALEISFTSEYEVLIVFNTENIFGDPVDTTTYVADDVLIGGGTVLGVFASAPANISDLIPGTTYYFRAFSVNGSDEYSDATDTVSASTDTFALQVNGFGSWSVVDVVNTTTWSVSNNTAVGSGFQQGTPSGSPSEAWLISPELDFDSFVDETFEFSYLSEFDDTVTGLEFFFTNAYTGDPSTTTWTAFSAQNDDFTTNAGTDLRNDTSLDLSALTGASIRIAFKYTSTDDGGGTSRRWTLSDPLISGNNGSDSVITLSAAPASVDEGASRAVNLSLPSAVGSDTVFFLTSTDADNSELDIPSSVTVLSGSDNVDFTVNGLSDGLLDGDQSITLIANQSGFTLSTLDITVTNIDVPVPSGDIIFTQYYEGDTGNNKWVEISNIGASPVLLDGYQVALWRDDNASGGSEAWKSDGGTPDQILDLSGVTLASGESYLIANPDTTIPFDTSFANTTSAITFFGGDDSLTLYSDATGYLTANLVDAISFTIAGNEGVNKSYVRTLAALGYDLLPGSSIEDYDDDNSGPAVWTEVTIATANTAVFGDDAYLGTTGLIAAPTSVNFTLSAQAIDEASGTVTLTVQINNPDGNAVDVDVVFDTSNSTASLVDIDNYSTGTISFGAGALNGDTQTLIVTLTDDTTEESSETAIFFLDNVVTTGDTSIKIPSSTTITIQDDDTPIPQLIISEVADPSDVFGGRFVELYNAGSSPVDLDAGNWNLTRFVNANSSRASIALTGTIAAGETYVIANNATDFALYGVGAADLVSSTISGNGDDTYALYSGGDNTTGILVDIYGVIGTDGSGEPFEYEDTRAYRNSDITQPNTVWTASEWTIEATAAVADMTPGVHPDGVTPPPSGPTYPITEDFSGTSTWVNQTVSGSFPWQIDSVDGRAEADGFADGVSNENHYLVSPEFDFSSVTDVTIEFDYGEAFDGPDLELLYSTNYSGSGDPEASGVVWSPIGSPSGFVFTDTSVDGTFSASSSGVVNLPSTVDGQAGVYLAFKYTAGGTVADSEQWYVDNIVVNATASGLDTYLTSRSLSQADLATDTNGNGFTVIEEYLAGFGDGVGPDALEYGIDLDPDLALTLINDRPERPLDIIVELLATSDLTVPFASVPFFYGTVDNGDGTYTHSYIEATPPAPAGDTRFLRLQITVGTSEENF